MKKNITNILSILTILFSPYLFGQGSGTALDFDGTNDFVSIGTSATLRPTAAISVEAWVKPDAIGTWIAIIGNLYDSGASESGYGIITNGSTGRVMFWVQTVGNPSNGYNNYPQIAMSNNIWQHIAGTYDGTVLRLYINGVLVDSKNRTGNIDYSPSPLDCRIGQYYDNNEEIEFNGRIDEVRIWNTARTEAQIKTNMCKKLTGAEAGLLSYWRFDDGAGTNLNDLTSNNLDGTLNNMNNADWVTSAAAIGDASSFLYTNSWGGQTVNLTSTNKGDFEVNTVTGNPNGVQVYRVDAVPNSTTGINPALGTNDTYYGTFVINGTSPTYTAEYNYSNYPDAIAKEPDLTMYYRDDNADPTWLDLVSTTNAAANTTTEINLSARGEFILAGTKSPLPIDLLFFQATLNNKYVSLDWQTASEINNAFFTIERSKDATTWEELLQVDGAGNSSTLLSYSETDTNPHSGVLYYRLKQTDFDGKFEYSQIVAVSLKTINSISIFPNPSNKKITLRGDTEELQTIYIYNSYGQDVTIQTQFISKADNQIVIDLSNLSDGIYLVKTKTTFTKIYKLANNN